MHLDDASCESPLPEHASTSNHELFDSTETDQIRIAANPDLAFENRSDDLGDYLQATDLHDIAEASFGPPPSVELEAVFGPDDRQPINDTTQYPFRAICSLLITANDDTQWLGTGWFISPRTLITAGHCVCIKGSAIPNRNGWVKSVTVIPGRNGGAFPYGVVTSNKFQSVTGWTNDGNPRFDYGAIIISNPIGDVVGWLGLDVYSDADLMASLGTITGYPADKLPKGTQWYQTDKLNHLDNMVLYYQIDTTDAQSGSALYRVVNNRCFAFGIHAYGGAMSNQGVRINQEVFQNLVSWKQ